MRVYLTLVCWLGISVSHSFSQRGNVSTIQTIDARVKNIMADLDNCEKEELPTDDSDLKNIYKCGTEKVVEVSVTDKDIGKKVLWIYLSNSLIYTEQIWSRKNDVIDRQKFYFDKNEMIAWLKMDGSFVNVNSDEFGDISRKIIAQSKRLIAETD